MKQETFGARVRRLRLGRRLNMAQLAEKIGSTPCLIMDVEAGRLDDLAERLRRLAMALHVSVGELLGEPGRLVDVLGEEEDGPKCSLYYWTGENEDGPVRADGSERMEQDDH